MAFSFGSFIWRGTSNWWGILSYGIKYLLLYVASSIIPYWSHWVEILLFFSFSFTSVYKYMHVCNIINIITGTTKICINLWPYTYKCENFIKSLLIASVRQIQMSSQGNDRKLWAISSDVLADFNRPRETQICQVCLDASQFRFARWRQARVCLQRQNAAKMSASGNAKKCGFTSPESWKLTLLPLGAFVHLRYRRLVDYLQYAKTFDNETMSRFCSQRIDVSVSSYEGMFNSRPC